MTSREGCGTYPEATGTRSRLELKRGMSMRLETSRSVLETMPTFGRLSDSWSICCSNCGATSTCHRCCACCDRCGQLFAYQESLRMQHVVLLADQQVLVPAHISYSAQQTLSKPRFQQEGFRQVHRKIPKEKLFTQ